MSQNSKKIKMMHAIESKDLHIERILATMGRTESQNKL